MQIIGLTEDEILFQTAVTGCLVNMPVGVLTDMAMLAGKPTERELLRVAKCHADLTYRGLMIASNIGLLYGRLSLDASMAWQSLRGIK